MIPEDAIWILELIRNRDARTEAEKDAVNAAIEALKAQLTREGTTKDATSDLISRQAAIDAFDKAPFGYLPDQWMSIKTLEGLPPAQPEPKEGHWIEGGIYRDVIECNCSECGQLMTTAASVRMNYCPNCGAKMTISTK